MGTGRESAWLGGSMQGAARSKPKGSLGKGFLCVLGLMATFLMACAAPTTAPGTVAFEPYRSPDQSFTVSVPQGWARTEDGHPYGDLTQISGVRLTGPGNAAGVPITISVLHYSGEHLFKTPEEFIHHEQNSIIRIDPDRQDFLRSCRVAGRWGRTFQIKTFELVYERPFLAPPLHEGVVYELVPPHKQIKMRDRYVVLPARTGYFVLKYRAPQDIMNEYISLFDGMIESFHPLLP